MKSICLSGIIFFLAATLLAQTGDEIPLWPQGAPGSSQGGGSEKVRINEPTGDHVVTNIHSPSIKPFLPSEEKATGAAVIIAPGGGHRELWIDHEGYNIAQWLSEQGVAAFVLKYRLANAENSSYTVDEHAVPDMLRAIRMVRNRAAGWNIDPDRIGIMGFSAGGEVTALSDMRKDQGMVESADPVDRERSVPAFHALIYPGRSNRIEPSEKSSPVFILCGYQDREDISKGMASLYLKYKEAGVPAELHIYANSGHGFGLRKGDTGATAKWLERMYDWMDDQGYLKK